MKRKFTGEEDEKRIDEIISEFERETGETALMILKSFVLWMDAKNKELKSRLAAAEAEIERLRRCLK